MAVCALTMLDGLGDEVTAAGGVALLALALLLAWLSTHVAERGDHALATIFAAGTQASLVRLGDRDGYGAAGSPSADASEQQSPPPSQEDNKPDDGDTERGGGGGGGGEGPGEGAEGAGTDRLLDIQGKQPHAGGRRTSDEDDDEVDEEELEDDDKKIESHIPALSSAISPPTTAAAAASCISVRLKFLNDTEEVAVVEPRDTVGGLKSKYFSGREHRVKLIYHGQLLQDPKRTLLSLNITHNSVIHCHVAHAPRPSAPEEGARPGGGAEVGSALSGGLRSTGVAVSTSSLVVPVFVVILAVVWYFRLNYRHFFTAPATVSLVGVTVFFSFLIFGMHRR